MVRKTLPCGTTSARKVEHTRMNARQEILTVGAGALNGAALRYDFPQDVLLLGIPFYLWLRRAPRILISMLTSAS